jgi:hypothetical protein
MIGSVDSPMILLMQADAGGALALQADLRTIPGVVDTEVTSGAYDVICCVDARDDNTQRDVLDAVRQARGLALLRVCRAAP